MLQISTWKRVLIWAFTALILFMAVPNLFYPRVESHNDALKQIEAAGATPELQEAVSAWPSWMPSGLLNLGLDLRGGAYLLADVQVEDVYAERMNGYWPEVRDALREKRDTVGAIRRVDGPAGELHVKIANPEARAEAIETAKGVSRPILSLTGVGSNDIEVTGQGDTLIVTLSEAEKIATDDRTVKQSLEIVRRRVDEAGTREPSIQRQGETRIIIQVPGIGSAQELKDLIGQTAKLTFHPVVSRTSDPEANPGARNLLVPSMDESGTYYIIEETFVVSGDELTDAQPSFDQNGRPAVSFRFNPTGARKFGDYTRDNIGSPFAIVLDNEVISAPTIQDHIPGGSGIITGNFTIEESTNLAVLLRAGALPAEMTFLQERTIGPELGADSIEAGRIATIVAFIAVLAFMWLSYGLFGIFANIALIINVGLIFGLLSIIGATLTLPGIAGIVLTVGMAVDANVLVFERIREELKTARGPSRAIELGYEKALSAILDANVTTFITAAILFALGSGPVRGFAITLGLGILTSVFCAIYITRMLIVMWFERRRPKTIEV
ncbi:protein translocase subunit SecD [Aliiruegeria lutimaris]|uniref:Protein translocase subunit SecD n=1 Tax=Aliiruegeria lutimaris TaxID=571298 RepID=A0A1G8IFR0_9RHOB|nr:protein translocase subunit SecD [Aliiruegeria lutimaris]SDI17692.1 preprotein translocase subunit SecD [Aliiruegeria lutimaris]